MSGEPPDLNTTSPSEVDPLVGRTIGGKFVIERLLGAGAMGAVYRAHQTALERTVAIKVMHRSIAADPMYAARFHREAKAVSRLDHPNLIRVLDYGQEADGLLYIAMEFLDGRDLFSVIEEEWPLSHERIVDILSQTLSALAEAHDAGVLHRDLKPENIMLLQRKGEDGAPKDLVKVCDFGIAKVEEPEARASASTSSGRKLTAAGLVVGTPGYMSPEQARSEPCDGRSDLYAMGVILYQLLSRRMPFDGNTPIAIVVKALHEAPPPLGSYGPTAAPGLEPICMKAMSKAREDRYQSAREMRAALRAATPIARQVVLLSMDRPSMVNAPTQAELVTNARPAGATSTPVPAASSPRSRRAGGLVAGLLVAGIAVVSVTKLRHPSPPPIAAAEPAASTGAMLAGGAPTAEGAVATVAPPPAPSSLVAPVLLGSASAPLTVAPSARAAFSTLPSAHRTMHEHDAKETLAIAPEATPSASAAPPPPVTPPPVAAATASIATPPPTPPPPPAIAAPVPPARPTFSLTTARVDVGQARTNNAAASGSAISHAIAPFAARFTDCYRAALAQATTASEVHGTLHLESDADQGYITTARVGGGAPEAAARCIEKLARTVRLDVDTGTANADVSLTFEPL